MTVTLNLLGFNFSSSGLVVGLVSSSSKLVFSNINVSGASVIQNGLYLKYLGNIQSASLSITTALINCTLSGVSFGYAGFVGQIYQSSASFVSLSF